ncbi:MAG: Arginine-tRNA ligase [Parcubacteria group bacterium GW2011_GWA2_33_14]|uniref:Arginine--tRNA ligase n=1 Tax=Candidatus Staskawiczbacteria bacterium RIFCSPHIGHO2_02_FULL_33_16 TaxID=1802204 RepID=A0A1G2HU77_9BACT|nr:MAG: Arginine-tRNA ligase [Parcubacteria group bacterium GW2011_GWA2_33_14]OGZ66064.1 MAG: arginine--tRNA ligase [Candidatus Staskawiczbacteria bacterium RIFCSPHIGHO2_02_FULL_33_16]OGZ70815.1 MAG: arginine--tRNA ligase [Candidatus Staskawiczbacteria bacterium RIFCSPLOWO2_01_FULL_33_13]
MNIKEEIRKLIEKAIKSFGSYDGPVLVETPKEKTHGDYSTNIALALAKKLNKNPIEVAGGLVKELSSKVLKNIGIEKVEVAGPGFINFYLSKKFFVENLKKINKNFGKNSNLKDQKVIVEYTDPNPFKEFHIGHLMSNSIGESISRIFEFQGAKVKRANYQGDVGLHVAKAIWGKMQNQNQAWQNAYVFGSEKYEINETAKKEITELNKKIFERSDKNINALYDKGKKESLEYFEKIYKTLGTKFDYYFFESAVADFGKKIVENGLKSGIFEKGEKGATIFKGEKTGLHTRVFINSEGLPTYEAKELGLAHIKYKKYGYNQSVIITGNEINEYFKVLLSAMLQIFPELAEKTKHIGHGMMRLSEGKMSSRTGKIITFEFLLNKVEELVKEKIKDRDLSDLEKKEITEKVAIGALKYSILKQSIGSDIIYDFEKSISFEGDSGPYLQYSYARAQSVLKKAKAEKIKASLKNIPNEISKLEKDMIYFPEIVEKSGKEYEPHVITLYLTELAREFNNYYANNKIVDKNDDFSSYKVAITEAFSIIMKNSLWLLGIQAPEKM